MTLSRVAIALLLLASCGPSVGERAAKTREKMQELGTDMVLYKFRHGDYPPDAGGLHVVCIMFNPLSFTAEDSADGWGQTMEYTTEAGGFIIRSAGADGEFRTPDDMIYRDGSLVVDPYR